MATLNFTNELYKQLDFQTGQGYYEVNNTPNKFNLTQESHFNIAKQLDAEAIFFIEDYPTVLFFDLGSDLSLDEDDVEEKIRQLHLDVWNTGQIPLFFVALLGELRVYNTYQKPVRDSELWKADDFWLAQIKAITQSNGLNQFISKFSRSSVETGNLFEVENKAFRHENRVDQWLLRNLRLLRQKLEGKNRNKRLHIHALIGRSIFIRYLECREVLVEEYFKEIGPYNCYMDVLTNKEDTYQKLFPKLNADFNGDLFPLSPTEPNVIESDDLLLLRDFLRGRSMEGQPDLLFWAYKFDLIPIELISKIYEEFYHEHNDTDDKGTHYTSTNLVEFVLSECLPPARLDTNPRILDPACGSGIFLVEAFKRLVRHECRKQGLIKTTELPRRLLIDLLTTRIYGFDNNPSAIQIAAFSLYLAYLDFQEPCDIRQNKRLPKLVYDETNLNDCGWNLFAIDAFSPTLNEKEELEKRVKSKKQYKGRIDDVRFILHSILPIKDSKFDIIIGNPPWGKAEADNQIATNWCKVFRYPVGDKELSQCFIWRTQRLLKLRGEIGLLVSTGILFKSDQQNKVQDKTKSRFRQKWLIENRVRAVYNFAHVRKNFFRKQKKGAISPFAAVFFTPAKKSELVDHRVLYVTLKRKALIENLQVIVFDRTDIHKVRQVEFYTKDWLWKTYMWGNFQDANFINELEILYQPLYEYLGRYAKFSGQGFSDNRGRYHTQKLGVKYELPKNSFHQNKPFSELRVPVDINPRPISVARDTNNTYKGERFIIKRGVKKMEPKFGDFQARLAHVPFAFTDDFIGIRIDPLNEQQRYVLLGLVLSSLGKYYHFLTCSMWGLWHHKVYAKEHLNLPIHFPSKDSDLESEIIQAVKNIVEPSNSIDHNLTLFSPDRPNWQTLQDELDNTIFKLYELSDAQCDLVRDLCQVTLEYFYESTNAQALKPPTIEQLETYRDTFLGFWQERLKPKGKGLISRIYAPHHGLLVGMAFELVDIDDVIHHAPITDSAEWQRWYRRLSKTLRQEYHSGIYIDSVVKYLSGSSMFLIKRAERRLWTKSQAHQDAHELLTEIFKLEWQRG
ncbi:N-6 DNA methylase [Anaerolineales bacterium HSG6]|nr:N-6 DNA methylase [Anaerolineales bacterium HSG6]